MSRGHKLRKIDSLGFATPRRLTRRGIRPQGDINMRKSGKLEHWLAGVWDPRKKDSSGFKKKQKIFEMCPLGWSDFEK